MQVSFNQNTRSYNPKFQQLSPEEIAKHTKNLDAIEKFKTRIVTGGIKLDEADKANLTQLYTDLKIKKEVAVSFVLDKILKLK